jgi:hypothetical protein
VHDYFRVFHNMFAKPRGHRAMAQATTAEPERKFVRK